MSVSSSLCSFLQDGPGYSDSDGGSPLHYAARAGHGDVVAQLLAASADANAEDTVRAGMRV